MGQLRIAAQKAGCADELPAALQRWSTRQESGIHWRRPAISDLPPKSGECSEPVDHGANQIVAMPDWATVGTSEDRRTELDAIFGGAPVPEAPDINTPVERYVPECDINNNSSDTPIGPAVNEPDPIDAVQKALAEALERKALADKHNAKFTKHNVREVERDIDPARYVPPVRTTGRPRRR